MTRDSWLAWWLGGLGLLVVSLFIHAPLAIEAVPGGILDHQSAGNAARVNAIQEAWAAAGLLDQARIAMAVDLVFIWAYSLAAMNGGRTFRDKENRTLSVLGWIALGSASIFFLTDLGETSAQVYQLNRFEGSDGLALIASSLGPPKLVSFFASLGALVAALLMERRIKTRTPQ